jgi:hypothetical protein
MSATAQRSLADASRQPDNTDWDGPKVPYDLAKEFVIALVVVTLLVLGLAAVFSSPDDRPLTVQKWANNTTSANGKFAGQDLIATAMTELDGSSALAQYGPPYNSTPGAGQKIGPLSLQRAVGVHIPIDTAQDFVLRPLQVQAAHDPALAAALRQYQNASSQQQSQWTTNYEKALGDATLASDGTITVAPGDYGPVPVMMDSLLVMAQSGALDNALLASKSFYGTDYTKALLFIADGAFLADKADAQHLSGSQWGMMNETGNFPGQAWLWLYTMWYQVAPFNTSWSANTDALVWTLMMLLTLVLLFLPFIPGLRSIPKWVPVYRAIWRDHYRALAAEERAAAGQPRAPASS